jgi:hypothetical protein
MQPYEPLRLARLALLWMWGVAWCTSYCVRIVPTTDVGCFVLDFYLRPVFYWSKKVMFGTGKHEISCTKPFPGFCSASKFVER